MPASKPVQQRIDFAPSAKAKKPSLEDRNREAASIILADPGRHGGEGSLPVKWARRTLESGA